MKMYEVVKMSGMAKDAKGLKTVISVDKAFKDSREATTTWIDISKVVKAVKNS